MALERVGPVGCVDEPDVREAIDRFLMRTDFGDALADVRVRVEIAALEAGGHQASIHIDTPEGPTDRSLDAEDCARLTDAVGLVVAVALDPLIVAAAVEPAPEPEPEPPPEPQPEPEPEPLPTEPVVEPPPPEPEKPSPRMRGFMRPAGVLEAGTLPGIGGGVSLAGGLIWDAARLELQASYLFPREHTPYPDLPGVGARLSVAGGGIRGCYVPRARTLEFPICAGFEMGAMRGEGIGLGTPRVDNRLWSAATIGSTLAWAPKPWFALLLRVDAMVTVVRPGFEVTDVGLLYRAPPAAAKVELGPEFRF